MTYIVFMRVENGGRKEAEETWEWGSNLETRFSGLEPFLSYSSGQRLMGIRNQVSLVTVLWLTWWYT